MSKSSVLSRRTFDTFVVGQLPPNSMSDRCCLNGYMMASLFKYCKYKRYRNVKTGVQRRSRVNELSKEKGLFLANIV